MPEDLPTPDKSIKQIEHERKNQLKKKIKRKDDFYDEEIISSPGYALFIVLSRHGLCRRLPGQSRSMKFHYTDCRTIKHPENFVPIDSRDEALAEVHVPFGVCKP